MYLTSHYESSQFLFINRFSVTVPSSVDSSASVFTVSQLTHYSNFSSQLTTHGL
jgi:hypothetical protein